MNNIEEITEQVNNAAFGSPFEGVPNLTNGEIEKKEKGTYTLIGKNGEINYIGKSEDIVTRATDHLKGDTHLNKEVIDNTVSVEFRGLGNVPDELLSVVESRHIERENPKYNEKRPELTTGERQVADTLISTEKTKIVSADILKERGKNEQKQ